MAENKYYERKIKYLDLLENGERIGGAGFVRTEVRGNDISLALTVRGLHPTDTYEREVMLQDSGGETAVGRISLKEGQGQFTYHAVMDHSNLRGIRIVISGAREIRCRWQEERKISAGRGSAVFGNAASGGTASADSIGRRDVDGKRRSKTAQETQVIPWDEVKAAEESLERVKKMMSNPVENERRTAPGGELGSAEREGMRAKRRAMEEETRRATKEEERRAAEEEERKATKEGGRRMPEEEGRRTLEEDTRRVSKEEGRRTLEEDTRRVSREEGRRVSEEGGRRTLEEDTRRVSKEEGRRMSEEDTRRVSKEEGRRATEKDTRRASKEEGRRMSEEDTGRVSKEEGRGTSEEDTRRVSKEEGRRATEKDTGRVSARNAGRASGREKKPVRLMEDKWQQIWAIYPHIQPFQDEREYLSISPADFVLLSGEAYRAANNSFLLHGYYNYDHLILTKLEKRGEVTYYIGVPGNYYEREKQVALMFGFESFECGTEPAQAGDFGYYMMRTQL